MDKFKTCGQDVRISKLAELKRPRLISIGHHVAIDSFVVCTTQLNLGSYIHISPQVGIIGGQDAKLTMEDFTFLSVGSKIICGGEKFNGAGLIGPFIPDPYKDELDIKPVKIERFAGVCANSVVLPGSIISEGSIIGANSLVLKNTVTKPWTIYAGSPIKEIKKRNVGNIVNYANEIYTKKPELNQT